MPDEIEGEAPNPFDDWIVDAKTMMILLKAAGWSWDYWGKFYGPDGIKVRDPRWVLHWVRALDLQTVDSTPEGESLYGGA